jgi:DNA-binding response OmpR family regulator
MADQKRILIIDDNFQVALFLRTSLEIIWPSFSIVNVPSAEEGILEMRRGVDLVIVDLKLPGMQGTEFIQRIQRTTPETPIIVITGEGDPQLHRQVRSLNLAGFFLKPLEVDELTAAIRRILTGEAARPAKAPDLAPDTLTKIFQQLGKLRVDTGARYVMLVDSTGRCVVEEGQVGDLDIAHMAVLLADELVTFNELARVLKTPQPLTINYQAGSHYDLYAANVGPHYVTALVFDAERGRGQIGTVWLYTRRAVEELLALLVESAPLPAEPLPEVEADLVEPAVEPELEPEPESPPEPELQPMPEAELEPEVEPEPAAEAGNSSAPQTELPVIPLEEDLSTDEVDAFWDGVLDEAAGEGGDFGGIGFDEALARGLLPSDFGKN